MDKHLLNVSVVVLDYHSISIVLLKESTTDVFRLCKPTSKIRLMYLGVKTTNKLQIRYLEVIKQEVKYD